MTEPQADEGTAIELGPDCAPAEGVRLLVVGGGVRLYRTCSTPVHETEYPARTSLLEGEADAPAIASFIRLLPPLAYWDVRGAGGGLDAWIHDFADGTASSLWIHRPAAIMTAFAVGQRGGSWERPRFARLATAGADATVVTAVDDGRSLAVFAARDALAAPACQVIGSFSDGCVLEAEPGGPTRVAVVKHCPTRAPARRGAQAGSLQLVPLGPHWEPAGPPAVLPGASGVYEFDAVLHDDELAVWATVEEGAWLLRGGYGATGFIPRSRQWARNLGIVTTPSIACLGSTLHLAVTSWNAGGSTGRVRRAALPASP